MNKQLRPIVWSLVVVASLAVGWFLRQVDTSNHVSGTTSPGNYLLIAGGSDDYWNLCISGAQAYADEAGATLDVRKPANEGEQGLRQQMSWLTSLAADEYDGVALGPISSDRESTLINALAEKLPVVTLDSDAPTSRRMFYIGSSNLEAGTIAADMVKAALPDGGKVAVLMASEEKTNAAQRKKGLEEALAQVPEDPSIGNDGEKLAEYPIVGFYLDQGDLGQCRENVKLVCTEHEDIAAIVGTFGYHGPAILDVLTELDLAGKVQIIAFDEADPVLKGIDDGLIHGTIVQDPFLFGAEAIQMLEQVHKGQFLSLPIGGGAVGVHCRAITKSNIDEFRKQLSQRLDSP